MLSIVHKSNDGRKFEASNVLHKNVHERKKTFKCEIFCTRLYRGDRLKEDIALVHEGKKPFSCKSCGATIFGRKEHLNEHFATVHNSS